MKCAKCLKELSDESFKLKKVKQTRNKTCMTCLQKDVNRRNQNKEAYLTYQKAYRGLNGDYFKTYHRNWKRLHREYYPSYVRTRFQTDLRFKAIETARQRLSTFLDSRDSAYKTVVGCSKEEFISYIFGLFQPGMTWENHGEWHLDHSFPLSRAYDEGADVFLAAQHFSNLKPMWANENKSKFVNIVDEAIPLVVRELLEAYES